MAGNRGTGKTLAMVKTLPAAGSIVIVHTVAMKTYLRHMVADVRGADVLKVTDIRVFTRPDDVERLMGDKRPVFIDHAWHDFAKGPAFAALFEYLNTRKV